MHDLNGHADNQNNRHWLADNPHTMDNLTKNY